MTLRVVGARWRPGGGPVGARWRPGGGPVGARWRPGGGPVGARWRPGGGPFPLTRYSVYIYEKQSPSPCNGTFFPCNERGKLLNVQRDIYSKEIALYEECVVLQM